MGYIEGKFLGTGNACLKLFSVIAENVVWSWCNRHYLVTAICRSPSWTPETEPNGALVFHLTAKPVYTVFRIRHVTCFLVNLVEKKKLNQTAAELSFGWVFGFQLCLRQTQWLHNTERIIIIGHCHLEVFMIWWLHYRQSPMGNSSWYYEFSIRIGYWQ